LGSQNAATGLLDSFYEGHISHGTTRSFMLTKALHLFPGDIFPYKTAPVIHHFQQWNHLHQLIINTPRVGAGTAPFV